VDVTVEVLVKEPKSLDVGDQAVFFTNMLTLGEGATLRAVEYRRIIDGKPDPRAQVVFALQAIVDEDLAKRLAAASLVIVGKVSSVKVASETLQPHPVSEHYPEWRDAVIEVEAMLKGDTNQKTVVLRFPGSDDIAFHQVPKATVGQRGIWILQPDARQGAPRVMVDGREREAHMASDANDFHPMPLLERIRELLKR
jgi:hypothetical protein